MKMNQFLFYFSLILLFSTTLAAQSPAAAPKAPAKPAPAKPAPVAPAAAPPAKSSVPTLPQSPSSDTPDSSAPDDIIRILRKAKSYNVLIRLLKTTQLINQINSQIITTKSGGLTILAPDDSAFSELKAGYLNSLSDDQKIELVQFHVLPIYVASNNFDSLANPVRTVAGDDPVRLQLNVTAYGNSVNISTGLVNATVTGVVYSDKQVAIYHVDKVLLPLAFVKPKPIAPAPALAKAPRAEKEKPSSEDDENDTTPDNSDAIGLISVRESTLMSLGVALVAAAAATIWI